MTVPDAIHLPWHALRSLVIVLSQEQSQRLAAVAVETTTDALRVEPVMLVDGRMVLPADMLTEVDGRLSRLWARVDASGLANAVPVVPMADVVGLLPRFGYGGQS